MLTLSGSLRLPPFTVYRDVVYRDGARAYTATFYALPDAPRLARDAAGGPAFDFLWYRTPPDAGPAAGAPPRAGGLVTLTVELGPSPAESAALAQQIAAALAPEPLPGLQILPLPVSAGTVALSFAGEGSSGGDLATAIGGNGPARLAGAERATFAVELSKDGAALLWQAIAGGLSLFLARYDLVFEHRLDDVELRVWCDLRRAHDAVAARLAAGPGSGPAALRDGLVEQQLAGITLTAGEPLAADRQADLEELGKKLLGASLASSLYALDGGGAAALRPYDPALETTANHTFTESFPAERHAVLAAVLELGATAAELGDRIRQVDLDGGFFRVLEVKVYCTVDFARDLIASVKVTISYDATGPGGRVQRSGELLFRDGADPVQTFRTDVASPDQLGYRYDVLVFYRGNGEPLALAYPQAEGDVIVLDLDHLGVLAVDLALRDVPLARVRAAVVDLEVPERSLAGRFVLDGEHVAAAWQAVVRPPFAAAAPYRYKVAWLAADGRRLEGDWQASAAAALALDAPAELTRTARVELISAGDFSGLAQIVVELRPAGPADPAGSGTAAPPVQLAFTAPGQAQAWEPPAGSAPPGGGFRYQARRSLVYADGSVRQLDWSDEDAPLLVVRDLLRFDLLVIPRLLDLGGSLSLALLALEFEDAAAALAEQTTLVLKDRGEEPRWSFRLAAPDRHRYRYQLTLVAGSTRTATPWQEAEDAILVLRPPTP